MKLYQLATSERLGSEAALLVTKYINQAIDEKGVARIIFSTGASQFDTIKSLLDQPVDWSRVEAFHLDEYIGLDESHPASFVRYLKERLTSKVNFKKFHFIDGTRKPEEVIEEITNKLRENPIDIALIGIGENGHIAFNDPPCDIKTKEAYHVVALDNKCRMQQVREGWYRSIDEVPEKAISMTVYEILQAKAIVSAVPYAVKAEAVNNTLTKDQSPYYPSTYLRDHKDWHLFIDNASASLIKADKQVNI